MAAPAKLSSEFMNIKSFGKPGEKAAVVSRPLRSVAVCSCGSGDRAVISIKVMKGTVSTVSFLLYLLYQIGLRWEAKEMILPPAGGIGFAGVQLRGRCGPGKRGSRIE